MQKDHMIIRAGNLDDVESIYTITCNVHLGPLYKQLIPPSSYERFRQVYTPNPERKAKYYKSVSIRMDNPNWGIWVAEIDGTVRGFTMTYKTQECLKLRGLFVDENWQGKGIGSELFRISLSFHDGAKPILLEVIKKNKQAIKLYKHANFRDTKVQVEDFFDAPMLQMRKY